MKTMAITDLKAHALQVLGEVAERKETVIVTKHVEYPALSHGGRTTNPKNHASDQRSSL